MFHLDRVLFYSVFKWLKRHTLCGNWGRFGNGIDRPGYLSQESMHPHGVNPADMVVTYGVELACAWRSQLPIRSDHRKIAANWHRGVSFNLISRFGKSGLICRPESALPLTDRGVGLVEIPLAHKQKRLGNAPPPIVNI
ncbi:hypothetical protein GS636_10580 [Ruegeria sp. HKCCD4884]|uniref:hypothetical protein n=1 Tax=Ruegeria sp. HKCCD4884 TaxID=2683022 RepID=UPI0014911E9D|nr:hypothetical protein [Ruegeria sp. HKCCD4884]NOD93231.1 hypothetical protein [Ruegeria sp. HKCCD4884]